jgi:hypothetical protein
VLWGGGTLFDANPFMAHGFLRLSPADINPAHVAFGFGPVRCIALWLSAAVEH